MTGRKVVASNNAQIRALAQQIRALATNTQVQAWAQSIYDASPDIVVVPPTIPTAAILQLFEHDDYKGKIFSTNAPVQNLSWLGFNDTASSADVVGRWEVFADADFGGRRTVLEPGKYPSLRAVGINDSISSCRPVETSPTVSPSSPPSLKRYVCSFGGSPDPVCDYVNIRFLPCWGTTEIPQMIDQMVRTKALGVPEVVMNTDWLMWSHDGIPVTYLGSSVAIPRLVALCDAAKAAGVLNMIKFWIMPDEPARDAKISEQDFRRCALDMLAVSAMYQELVGVRLAVIYGDENDRRLAMDLMGLIGFDHYDMGARILDGVYSELEGKLSAGQSLMAVPGMYTLDHKPMEIEAFLAYMQAHPRVQMMMVFLYDIAQGGYGFNGTAGRVLAVSQAIKRMNSTEAP